MNVSLEIVFKRVLAVIKTKKKCYVLTFGKLANMLSIEHAVLMVFKTLENAL